MAPKAKKMSAADRTKAVEDKTFGLKNKKGGKAQKYVAQVMTSVNANANRGQRGPTKKELKELQKQQEEEMMALFTAVPKKKDETKDEAPADLNPDEGPTFTDITQEIEYQRANVVAKTKITDEVFRAWREKKMAKRKKEEEEARAERRRRGLLTGREIFLEASSSIVDDEAADDDDMQREIDEEEEIRRMEEQYRENNRLARELAGLPPEEDAPSGSKPPPATTLQLSAQEQAELFDDDDDDDDDEDLDELENQVRNTKV